MHWTSWFHCLNDTSVLPGVTLLLKVLIFGVTKHRPDVRAVISCSISDLDGAGHGTGGGGPGGTLPPSNHSGSADGVGCFGGPHLPPPGKVTSWSSSLGSLLPDGHTHSFRGGPLGVHVFCIVQFPVLGPPQADAACGQQGHQVLLGDDAVFPCLGEFVGQVYVALSPHWGDLYATLLGVL